MTNTAQRIQLILAGWDGQTPITGTINTGPISQSVQTIAAEIDGLRDEMAVILRERNDAHLALAEARAEVERLRLPAEAWEKQETYDNLTGYEPNLPELWQKRQSAAARAREARK